MIYIEMVIRPLSDWMTPWQADTLFGHLAWSIRFDEGERELQNWLERFFTEEPPVVLSDGFIGKWLPRPILPPLRRTDSLEEAKEAKHRKSMRWVDREALLRGTYNSSDVLSKNGDPNVRAMYHNVINRMNHRSLNEDGLYVVEQYGMPGGESFISIYARLHDNKELERLKYHMERLSMTGYGKRKSVGMGRFELVDIIPRDDWFSNSSANAHLWLSHGVPAPIDPVQGWYRLDTKYGKIGEGWDGQPLPFKRPITRLVPGSVFLGNNAPRNWSGRMIRGILESRPEVVQYALALTLPFKMEDVQIG